MKHKGIMRRKKHKNHERKKIALHEIKIDKFRMKMEKMNKVELIKERSNTTKKHED